ncbi:MAG: S41 family peptidase [Firmicutes bacterium]|nr:S41 family peptidase [Bacillota bacterium]
MNKKSFYMGVLTGVASAVVAVGAINVASVFVRAEAKGEMSITDKIDYIGSLLNKYYVDGVDAEQLTEGIYYGMADSLGDPYTSYLNAAQTESFMSDSQGNFYGIGVTFLPDYKNSKMTVVSPMEGSPAEEAGILPGDEITEIDGFVVKDMYIDEAVAKIKGEVDTLVNIKVYRPSENKYYTFDIKRSIVEVESVAGKMLDDKIGYIAISGFKGNTFSQFEKIYDEFMAQGVEGLIIDVRNNPGGLLTAVNQIADKLLPEGTIVYTIDKNGERIDYNSDSECIKVPLCLLVNGNSASASEILAGAVQDSGTGKLVGTQTFGKGLVQNIFTLPDGSALKITIQKYYTPKGVCIQGSGITPDYVVELPKDVGNVVTEENDTQLMKAIEVIKSEL